MRLRKESGPCFANLLAIATVASAAGVAGCSSAPGELVVVVQTDMNVPRDIERIHVAISAAGIPRYSNTWDYTDRTQPQPFLPATLGVVASEKDPSLPVTIEVSASANHQTRILREIVIPVPEGRVAALNVPLHFLCDGSASGSDDPNDDTGPAKSACPAGQTCIAGTCAPSKADPAELPDYSEPAVFGGGTGKSDGVCFDVASCFGTSTIATLDRKDCTIADPGGDFNVALLAEGQVGMCAGMSCYIALDAGSAAGWTKTASGRIALPPAVCKPMPTFAQAAGVAVAPVRDGCPRKTISVPICGEFSSVGKQLGPEPMQQPTVLAHNQEHPVSLAVSPEDVVWANAGLFDPSDPTQRLTNGSVKTTSAEGGRVVRLDNGDGSPRQVSLLGKYAFWTSLLDSKGNGAIYRFVIGKDAMPTSLAKATWPDGIAAVLNPAHMDSPRVFWTDYVDGTVNTIDGISIKGNNHPSRIDYKADHVCWAEEGMLGAHDGKVSCIQVPAPGSTASPTDVVPGGGLATPRALAIDPGGMMVYWANFDGGTIQAGRTRGGLDFTLENQAHPNGVAVDDVYFYWTNYGDGTVHRRDKANSSAPDEVIASGQNRPSDIKVNDKYVFWVNEGSLSAPDGAVMRLAKK